MKQKSMHRCPYCFAALPSQVAFRVCQTQTLEDGTPCQLAEPKLVRLGSLEDSQTLHCPDHGTKLVDSCYADNCKRALPARWSEVTTTAVAMAGTRAAGKTVYLVQSSNLLRGWGKLRGITVSHYDQASKDAFEEYYGVLESGQRLFGSTVPESPSGNDPQQTPVLLRLQRPNLPDHVLILRDVAGEDLQNAVMDLEHFRFLANADGLILTVDPAESQAIRTALTGVVPLAHAEANADAVWGNLQALQLAVNGPQADQIPLALTISKLDLLDLATEQAGELRDVYSARGSRMFADGGVFAADFDRRDADLLDLELRTLLRRLGQESLLRRAAAVRGRSEVRLFAVSSLGHAPTANRVAATGAIPFRLLDPVKWFLAEAGVIAGADEA